MKKLIPARPKPSFAAYGVQIYSLIHTRMRHNGEEKYGYPRKLIGEKDATTCTSSK